MAGLPHDRLATVLPDPRCEIPRALNVKNNFTARISRQYVRREEHQLSIRINDRAALGNHAHAITIAIESKPDFRVRSFKRMNQILKILRYGWVRMMIRKSSIDVAEQLRYLAPQSAV